MNRIAGIIVAALGFVVAVISVTKIVPGVTLPGVLMILLGGLIIGLSFIDKPLEDGTERMTTLATIANIFVAPGETFRNLRRHPRWLVALLVITVLSATYTNLFMERLGPERIVNFTMDKTLEMPMISGNEDARKQVESGRAAAIADAKSPVVRAGQAVSSFAGATIFYAILALIFFLFAMAMGGKINFWQAFSAAIYAALPISIIRFILNTVILFVKDPSEIHPILGQQSLIQDNLSFFVVPSEHPVIYSFLAAFSVLGIYWVVMNAIGLKNAGERVSGTIAWSASITIFVIILLFSLTMAALFPGFIS